MNTDAIRAETSVGQPDIVPTPMYRARRRALDLARFLKRSLQSVMFALLDTTVLCIPSARRESGSLIVRLDSLGDFILWLPAARVLSESSAGSSRTLLCNSAWADIASEERMFDRIIPLCRKRFIRNPFYRWALLARIRRAGFSRVIHPTRSREFLFGDAVVRVAGADESVGHRGDRRNCSGWEDAWASGWYSYLVPVPAPFENEVVTNEVFLKALGLPAPGGPPGLEALSSRHLPARLLREDYFLVVPGGSQPAKRWPADRFARLASKIRAETGWLAVLVGSKEEFQLAGPFLDSSALPAVLNLIGKTSLHELLSLVASAKLVLANDSGPVHVAAAASTPSLCFLGGGEYGRFLPYPPREKTGAQPLIVDHRLTCYGCDWNCVHRVPGGRPYPCVDLISEEAAWGAARKILAGADGAVEKGQGA